MMTPIRVLIADDHPIVRHGLRSLFALYADIVLVGEVDDGSSLLAAVGDARPDVIVLDLRMPRMNGVDALRQLRHALPGARVVVLSSYAEPEQVLAAIEAGATAYVLKSSDYHALIDVVRAAANGKHFLSPSLIGILCARIEQLSQIRTQHESGLDGESLKVLALLAEGATNNEIAAQLHWSEVTVKRRIQDILDTIGARNRTQAVAEAIRRGWV